MAGSKPRKDKVKADIDQTSYHSQPRENKPNTPGGHSDKIRQTDQGDNGGIQ